jgi:hypothetical protein
MKRNHCAAQLAPPSPRLPSGRLRSSPSKTGVNALSPATGYGEGRGEGNIHRLGLAERPPHPPPPFPPPQAGEGRVGRPLPASGAR